MSEQPKVLTEPSLLACSTGTTQIFTVCHLCSLMKWTIINLYSGADFKDRTGPCGMQGWKKMKV